MRHLSGDPKANLVILGDFNEGHPVGSDSQALGVLFQAKPSLVDFFNRVWLPWKPLFGCALLFCLQPCRCVVSRKDVVAPPR